MVFSFGFSSFVHDWVLTGLFILPLLVSTKPLPEPSKAKPTPISISTTKVRIMVIFHIFSAISGAIVFFFSVPFIRQPIRARARSCNTNKMIGPPIIAAKTPTVVIPNIHSDAIPQMSPAFIITQYFREIMYSMTTTMIAVIIYASNH